MYAMINILVSVFMCNILTTFQINEAFWSRDAEWRHCLCYFHIK